MKKIKQYSDLFNTLNTLEKFCQYHLFIRNKYSGLDYFRLNKEQLYIDNVMNIQKKQENKVRLVVVKGRQIGATTYFVARHYYQILLQKGYKGMVLSHKQVATNNIFDIMYRFYVNSAKFLQPKIELNKNKFLQIKNNNNAVNFATAGAMDIGRSDTINFFHGSEVAYWPNADNHIASVLMAVPDQQSEVILESTSNGPHGIFYDMAQEALKGYNSYKLVFIPWTWHSEYVSDAKIEVSYEWREYAKLHNLNNKQLAWAYQKNQLLALSTKDYNKPSLRFYQEFPADFNEAFYHANSNHLINITDLLNVALATNFLDDPACDNVIKQLFYSQVDHVIILGVDVARGGNDYSWIIDRKGSFIGFNVNEKINTKDTMYIVGLIVKFIQQLNPAMICIDAGGGGIGIFDRLQELGYGNLVQLIYFGAKAYNKVKYFNKRAEMLTELCSFLYQGGYIVKDDTLLYQLANIPYFYTSLGQIQLVDKETIKQNIKQSTDGADAAALTFAVVFEQKSIRINHQLLDNDFDPLEW